MALGKGAKFVAGPVPKKVAGNALMMLAKPFAQTAEAIPAAADANPLLLPAPQRAYVTDSAGVSRLMTDAEMAASATGRERAESLGMTSDVRKVISKNDLRQRIGSDWDKIDAENQNRIEQQVNAAWGDQKTPLQDIIASTKQHVDDLLTAKGEKMGVMGAALVKAAEKNNRSAFGNYIAGRAKDVSAKKQPPDNPLSSLARKAK